MFRKEYTSGLLIVMMLLLSVSAVSLAHGNTTNENGNFMGSGYNNQMNNFRNSNTGYNGMMGMMMGNNGMFGGMYSTMSSNRDYSLSAVGFTQEQIKNQVVTIIENKFGAEYVVGDIFIFNNSPYYISVIEKDTGHGAFELLFDPYRGVIFPEFGPNMMWNTKYNNMSNMMIWGDPIEENIIDRERALSKAQEFAKQNKFDISDEGHHFYGYYTFHTEVDGETTGMLSVNAYTGQVWYHNWHVNLDTVLEVKHSE